MNRASLYNDIRNNCNITTDNGIHLEVGLPWQHVTMLRISLENYIIRTLESYYNREFESENFWVVYKDDILNLPFEVLPKEKKNTNLTKEKILWDQAHKKIVNGNMLLSKSPNIFLPDGWPTYYSSAKKCYVWDINKKKFLKWII